MTLEQLARHHVAFESVDKSPFQRHARILQSIWRHEQQLPMGEQRTADGNRPLGSRLQMPAAQTQLWNFLTETVRDVVRCEVCDPHRSRGKLFGKPRIFCDLLSSQPLCFNLFAELRNDLSMATRVFRSFTAGRIHEVTAIEFEYSPGRRDLTYTGDRSAFDVFVQFDTPTGKKGFAGIEVKYHENLLGQPGGHQPRYDEIARDMGCFHEGNAVRKMPLQQLWRDHLLAGVLRRVGGYDDGFFAMLSPQDNPHCRAAIDAYRRCLTSSESFVSWTLEDVVAEIRRHTDDVWVSLFHDRYLNWEKLKRHGLLSPSTLSETDSR